MSIYDDLGFIILCPNMNIGGLRTTISTIKSNLPDATCMVMVAENSLPSDREIVKKLSKTVETKPTITTMINKGITESSNRWNCVIMSGSYIKYNIVKKYDMFVKKDTDIAYPIVDLKSWRFEESSLNGLLIHKKTFQDVGEFAENEHSLEICRLFWALDAIDKGYKFKGLVGLKIC